jgi:hypothetical protein
MVLMALTELSEWLNLADKPGFSVGELAPFLAMSRGNGKSTFMRDFMQEIITSAEAEPINQIVVGTRGILSMIDELQPAIKFEPDLIKRFSDPDWPAADVTVTLEKLDKKDPRHPNPEAGTIRRFYVNASGRRSNQKNKTAALNHGKRTHERLVAALVKDRDDRIAAEKRELLERHAYLNSLPTFGDY